MGCVCLWGGGGGGVVVKGAKYTAIQKSFISEISFVKLSAENTSRYKEFSRRLLLQILGGVKKGRGQKYFNIALDLQDELLTIFTRPANT